MPVIRAWPVWSSLLFAAAVALGVTVTHTTLSTPDELRLDQWLQGAHTGWLTAILTGVADAASPAAGLVIVAVWVVVLVATHRPVVAARTFLVLAVGWNISLVLKYPIARHRPPMATEANNSFPSGHVCFVTACVLAAYLLARGTRWQRPVATVGPLAVVLVGFSRIYFGAHYLTDTIGSLLATAATFVLLTGVWPHLEGRLIRLLPGPVRDSGISVRGGASHGHGRHARPSAAGAEAARGPSRVEPHARGDQSWSRPPVRPDGARDTYRPR